MLCKQSIVGIIILYPNLFRRVYLGRIVSSYSEDSSTLGALLEHLSRIVLKTLRRCCLSSDLTPSISLHRLTRT